MANLVGICGKMRHGKDTAASFLVERGYTNLAFADSVRDGLLKLDPIVVARQGSNGITNDPDVPITWLNRLSKLVDAVGWDEAKKSEDVRHHLQYFGTEVCRNMFGADCWIKQVDKKIQDLEQFAKAAKMPPPCFVISDVRFPNEGEYIKSLGGIILWVENPRIDTNVSHASEKMAVAQMADCKIENSGTLHELEVKVLEAVGISTPEEEAVA